MDANEPDIPECENGSYVVYGEPHGRLAGEIVLEILEGERLQAVLPRMDRYGIFYFNKSQLGGFSLTLPEETKKRAIFKQN